MTLRSRIAASRVSSAVATDPPTDGVGAGHVGHRRAHRADGVVAGRRTGQVLQDRVHLGDVPALVADPGGHHAGHRGDGVHDGRRRLARGEDLGRAARAGGEVPGQGLQAGGRLGRDPELLGVGQAEPGAGDAEGEDDEDRHRTRPRRQRGGRRRPGAMRAHGPRWERSASPARGMNGQKSRRPHRTSAAGRTTSAQTTTTTTPSALVQPMLRLPPSEANSSVSRARVTVMALPATAGPPEASAVRIASPVVLGAPQLLAVAGDDQQRVVGAGAEDQHAGDPRARAVERLVQGTGAGRR